MIVTHEYFYCGMFYFQISDLKMARNTFSMNLVTAHTLKRYDYGLLSEQSLIGPSNQI